MAPRRKTKKDGSALFRRSDLQTSRDAAAFVTKSLPHLENLVFGAIKRAGKTGMTIDELVRELKIDKVTLSPRTRPLCNKGLIREKEGPDGKRKGNAGVLQTVWVIVEKKKKAA